MATYIVITFILLKISIGVIGFKIYKLENTTKIMKKNMREFQKQEEIKREIGWDSIWKIVNQKAT
tara:strand:- start:830 stop:1024 length:195 start_codon:yes stop_codon:yes gene_type:complete